MNQEGLRTRKELILLWREGVEHPRGTFEWLKGSWFSGHYHVRAPDRMYRWPIKVNMDEKEIIDYYEAHVFCEKMDFTSDFARLSRILTGNAVGLVLGGGGARGAAHVGVIRAMRDHGIPVDIVGGTSIGSMVGGLYAEDPHQDLEARAKSWFMVMCSLWRKIWDLTYAHSAMFTGAGFNRTLQDLFEDKQIEDLWLPYFCITTDISTSEMRVHRAGPLWTYCRASMSLAGYLPPLCDPLDGHLLLDGGYVNNLPADVMRSTGARYVIAVDVGAATETDLYNYGDNLSGTWVLLKRMNPFATPVRILGMEEIQSRLAFVSCVRQLEMVKKAPYCHYLRPPIEHFKTLDFAKFDFICNLGYQYGAETFAEMIKNNANIKAVMNPDKLRRLVRAHSRRVENPRSLHSSFTDLAAQISRIPSAKRHHNSLTDLSVFDESDWYEDDDESTDVDTSYEDPSEPEDDESDSRINTPRI
ncbi:Patatin/Phospholipase A2-related [Aphelenchoides avenae]|nr:Patatin/Phospholipase A2-related [Aphelenchus avenae]